MQNIFYHPVIIDDLRGAEKKFNIKTSNNQNQYIAEILKVEGIDKLEAQIFLKANKHIIKIEGNIKASLELQSVISLENFKKDYEVDFETIFDKTLTFQKQRELENEGVDTHDVIKDGKIDLGELIIENLALNIEEYPRKDGEVFSL